MRVSEGVARPVRGLGQGGAGYLLVDLLDEFTAWEPTTRQYGLAVVALTTLMSFIQNLAENRGWVRPILRTIPNPQVGAEVLDERVEPSAEVAAPDAPDAQDAPDIKPVGVPASEFPDGDPADAKGQI